MSDSCDISSATSSCDSSSSDDYLDEKCVDPGPAEKQIEDYLKNFDLKSRIMKQLLEEKEKEKLEEEKLAKEKLPDDNPVENNLHFFKSINEEKNRARSPFQDEFNYDEMTNKIFTPREAEYNQNFQNPYHTNQQVWQNPYTHGNQWPNGPQNNPVTDNRLGNKFLNIPHSEHFLNPQCFRGYPLQAESTFFHQNPDLERISLTTQIIEMQKEDKINQLTDILERVKTENEDLKIKLKQQEEDLAVLGPRYKYLEENFEDFIKMKEEYTKIQRQKRKSEFQCTEVYDKYAQTWETAVMCEFCISTHEMLENIGGDNALCVQRSAISDLEEKFTALKEIISEREFAYENREEKAELIHLTALNVGYRAQILELEARHKQVMKWTSTLQNLIAKIYSPKKAGMLTYQEQEWVQKILKKFTQSFLISEEKGQEKKPSKSASFKKK